MQCTSASQCDDANPCTTDTCTAAGACSHTATTDGAPCSTASVPSGNCRSSACIPPCPAAPGCTSGGCGAYQTAISGYYCSPFSSCCACVSGYTYTGGQCVLASCTIGTCTQGMAPYCSSGKSYTCVSGCLQAATCTNGCNATTGLCNGGASCTDECLAG